MKKYEDEFRITLLIMLMAIAALLAISGWELVQIRSILDDMYNYRAEADICAHEAMEYLAPCHVERDEDGSYNWYFNPNEGRM